MGFGLEDTLLSTPTAYESNETTPYSALLRFSQDKIIVALLLGTGTTTGIWDSGAHTYRFFLLLDFQAIASLLEKVW
jgi:hypothetical protein